ncbi:type IV secretion system protein VirB4 [Rhodospirillaceae bacterium KN72]|uniref:Type IV secretion system protein VirB4 n=1 Tax=Pacificispira spongiicola TaxID=2729598 RepID=A0A7Y0DYH3_9PROT|nr:type IV secretion system protein VirB4 [Pacificispira spongiicola]NMM43931.1 type IV secretion system protein VirB4 [Pacificispira spongiicola]
MIWEEIATTGLLALGAGALATRLGRNLVLGSVEHDWLADELELDRIEPDRQTARLKSGMLFRVFRITGVSYDAQTPEQQEILLSGRSAALLQLGQLGLSVRVFGVKRQRNIAFEADWPSETLAEIGEAERRRYRESYFIDWFLVVGSKEYRKLLEGSGKVLNGLGLYRPHLLERPERDDAPCPLTGFVNFLICGDLRHDLPSIAENLSGALPASDLGVDKATGTIATAVPTARVQKIVSVRSWPEAVSGRIAGEVLAIPGDVEVSQVCLPGSATRELALMVRKKRELDLGLIGNPSASAEYGAAIELLNNGEANVWTTQFQVIARAETSEALDELVREITGVFGRYRVVYSVETAGAPVVWFNRIPGNDHLLRPLRLLDSPIAALWPFHYAAIGLEKSPYGDRPVRLFQTASGQAYAFQFHVAEKRRSIGNYLVFAPSGGGKSTLIMHLLGGLAKFTDVRSYVFDSKEGARFMVEAFGGAYQSYDSLALNPLDVGAETVATRKRIYLALKSLIDEESTDDEDEADLAHAVQLAFKLAPPERTLDAIYEFAFRKRSGLRRSMSKWVTDGKGNAGLNAHIFNAPRDSLSGFLGQSFLVGINMNEALGDPVLGPPIVTHIASAIETAAHNQLGDVGGFNVFIDEAANLMRNAGFKSLVAEWYREIRKLNGAIGVAFQDPTALFDSGVAEAVVENTATTIFFPNPKANLTALQRFNLNSEQIGFIMTPPAPGQRRVLVVKQDAAAGFEESAIVDVDLGALGDVTRFYDSGPSSVQRLNDLKQNWGMEWARYL